MTRNLFVVAILLILPGCFGVKVNKNELSPGHYYDECSISKSEFYKMTCDVYPDWASLHFQRWKEITLEDFGRPGKKDTVMTLEETYNLAPGQFRYLLASKNSLPRDTTIFKITSNMYCTWETFDRIFKNNVMGR